MPVVCPVHTYSIVARDPQTGEMGVAVQSHYFSVGPIVPWGEAGVGAVATQSFVQIAYGPLGLELMRQGLCAEQALQQLLQADDERQRRQVAMIDAHGNVAVHTGTLCIAAAGHLIGNQVSVQANLMMDSTIWPAMMDAYEQTSGDLAAKMMAALEAAQAAGGDIRGQQSAALLIVSGRKQEHPWQGRIFDLRVEDHPHPLEELKRLVQLRRAYQLVDQSDELMVLQRFDEASTAMAQALELAPDMVELRFWAGINRIMAGRKNEGQELLEIVFAREPIWRELIPRLIAVGLLNE